MKLLGVLVAIGVVVALLVTVQVQRAALRRGALERDSLEVAADSSRRFWHGQAQVAARRAFQTQIELSAALQHGRAQGAALVHARLEGDSLRRVLAGTVTSDTVSGTVTASGALDAESLGVTIRADVLLRGVAPVSTTTPVTSEFTWDVVRHPVLLDVALVCLPGHRAEARITSLTAVPLTVTGAASRPDICYPPPRWSPLSLRPPSLPWVVGAFVAGWLLGR